MKVRVLAAVAALALGTAIGGIAHANTYMLTVDGCSAGCVGASGNVGSVTVTQDAVLTGVLDFTVSLNTPGVVFNSNGNQNHHALAFDLIGNATTLAGLSFVTPVTGFSLNTSGGSEPPFGNFTDVVDYIGNASQGSAPSTLSFKLQDSLNNLTLAMLGSNSYTPKGGSAENIVLATDVAVKKGEGYSTGNVGALITTTGGGGGVPEPATWGLMIVGVFGVGAMMRQQRRQGFTA